MSVWLTLIGALLGTAGVLFGFYLLVMAILEGRKAKAQPKLGVAPGSRPGTLKLWVNWETQVFDVQIYRLRIQITNPWGQPKEMTFSYSFDPVQKAPFCQEIELPATVKALLENEVSPNDVLFTFDFRTIQETTLPIYMHMKKVRQIHKGKKGQSIPSGVVVLPTVPQDVPAVMSLDFEEWQARKKKIQDLESAAKAKAAKTAAAKPPAATPPAAPSAPQTTPTPSTGTAPPIAQAASAPAPEAAKATAAPASTSAELPSLKELIAQVNAKGKPGTNPA